MILMNSDFYVNKNQKILTFIDIKVRKVNSESKVILFF